MISPDKKYTVDHIRNIEDIEKIRFIWESMHNHPNSDIDHYLSLIHTRSNIIRPHVILITENGKPISLVVGRIENLPFDLKLGYKSIYCPIIKSFTIIYGGILGDLSNDTCEIIFSEVIKPLSNGEADLLRFNYIDVNTELYKLIETKPRILNRDFFPITTIHWRMVLPNSIEDFYKSRSSKHRSWLKRMERLLIKDYPEEIKYICYKNEDELEKVFADLEQIVKNTYQRRIGVGFSDNEETRKTFTHLTQKKRLRTYFLYIQNKPCAFWYGELYGNTFHLITTGYNPELRKYELGTVLFIKMLEDLCSIGNVRYLDFGFGDASYKSRFGDENHQEAIINIFSNRVNGLKINILRIIILGSQQLVKRILVRYNLLEKIKKLWQRK